MKKYFFVLIFFIEISTITIAQYNPDAINKKALKAYDDAMLQLRDGLIKDAIPLLGKAIEHAPDYVDAYLSMAGVYGELKNYGKSIYYYEIARSKDSVYFKYYTLPYSINLFANGHFQDALNAVNTFLTLPGLSENSIQSATYRKRCYEFALAYSRAHTGSDYIFSPINLGDNVNSDQSEYYPSMTIDDSLLVFTRRGKGFREEFVQSVIQQTTGAYTVASIIDGSINDEPFKGAISISQDGEWLLFAGNFRDKGLGDFDLYVSYYTPTGWSEPMNFGKNINTEYWESAPTLSPDKKTLYFSSNRPDGYGGRDLYMSERQSTGKWGKAVNMGDLINTKGDDQAPFIHADNSTLYFTSDGLQGYGGTDIFVARKKINGQWGTPENLGYPINTIENEGTLYVASDGITAYYASDRSDSRGGLDLYKFELRNDVRPSKTLYVKGAVFDAATKKGLPCTVELVNNNDRTKATSIQTDETGRYFITLPVGKDYTFTINRKGYLFYSDIYALSGETADSVYQKDIPLQPIVLNAAIVFKNIHFANNAYQLEEVSKIELDQLVSLLHDNPTVKVQISGHTDNVGKPEDNMQLSDNRAKAVVDYIVSKGIDISRLQWKGYGEKQSVADNNTEEGRALNRRTVFTITEL